MKYCAVYLLLLDIVSTAYTYNSVQVNTIYSNGPRWIRCFAGLTPFCAHGDGAFLSFDENTGTIATNALVSTSVGKYGDFAFYNSSVTGLSSNEMFWFTHHKTLNYFLVMNITGLLKATYNSQYTAALPIVFSDRSCSGYPTVDYAHSIAYCPKYPFMYRYNISNPYNITVISNYTDAKFTSTDVDVRLFPMSGNMGYISNVINYAGIPPFTSVDVSQSSGVYSIKAPSSTNIAGGTFISMNSSRYAILFQQLAGTGLNFCAVCTVDGISAVMTALASPSSVFPSSGFIGTPKAIGLNQQIVGGGQSNVVQLYDFTNPFAPVYISGIGGTSRGDFFVWGKVLLVAQYATNLVVSYIISSSDGAALNTKPIWHPNPGMLCSIYNPLTLLSSNNWVIPTGITFIGKDKLQVIDVTTADFAFAPIIFTIKSINLGPKAFFQLNGVNVTVNSTIPQQSISAGLFSIVIAPNSYVVPYVLGDVIFDASNGIGGSVTSIVVTATLDVIVTTTTTTTTITPSSSSINSDSASISDSVSDSVSDVASNSASNSDSSESTPSSTPVTSNTASDSSTFVTTLIIIIVAVVALTGTVSFYYIYTRHLRIETFKAKNLNNPNFGQPMFGGGFQTSMATQMTATQMAGQSTMSIPYGSTTMLTSQAGRATMSIPYGSTTIMSSYSATAPMDNTALTYGMPSSGTIYAGYTNVYPSMTAIVDNSGYSKGPSYNTTMTFSDMGNTMVLSNQKELSLPGHLFVARLEDAATVIKKLTSGGSGGIFLAETRVYLNNSIPPGTKVAIKILDRNSLSLASFDAAFKQEVAVTNLFAKHPNFVQIYGFSTNPNSMILKMYEMGSYKNIIYSTASIQQSVYETTIHGLLTDIITGLEMCHYTGVAHLDMKPDNVLVDTVMGPNNQVKYVGVLCDFSVSFILNAALSAVKELRVSRLKGLSAPYASPEMINATKPGATANNISYSADIFSFAMVAWESITRRTPRMAKENPEQLNAIMCGNRPQLKPEEEKKMTQFSRQWLAIVEECWNMTPEERPTANNILRRLKPETPARNPST